MSDKKDNLVPYDLIKAHLYVATALIVVVVVAGLAYSMQFIDLFPFKGVEMLSPGRIRMVHTQGVAYGWLANPFFPISLVGLLFIFTIRSF